MKRYGRNPAYRPTTGQKCSCRPGVWRDNCPACEGTGRSIDFAAIERARKERQGRVPAGMCDWPIYPRTCSLKKGHGGACVPYKERSNPSAARDGVRVRVELYTGQITILTFPRSKWPKTMNGRDRLISRSLATGRYKRWDEITARSNPKRRNPGFVRNASGMIGYYCWKCERWFWRTGGKLEANCTDCGKVCKAERRNPSKRRRGGDDFRAAFAHHKVIRYKGRKFHSYAWKPVPAGADPSEYGWTIEEEGPDVIQRLNPRLLRHFRIPSNAKVAYSVIMGNGEGYYRTLNGAKAALYTWLEGQGEFKGKGDGGDEIKEWDYEKRGHDRSQADDQRRSNPGLGMPGMPHTWVTAKGVHVSAGDTIDYWRQGPHQPRLVRAKVVKMLVFDDHVMADGSHNGDYVDDINFVRVVRKAARRNPILTVLSNPARSRRSRLRSRRASTPLCTSCWRQSTSGGHEPLGPGLRSARPRERCGAWDCVKRAHPERSRRAR